MSRMTLRGHGLSAGLPDGWEGAMLRQPDLEVARSPSSSALSDGDAGPSLPAVIPSLPVLHLASFPLPEGRGDFGSGAVDEMGPDDVLVALVEYGPENVGTPLFEAEGLPTRLRGSDFSRWSLQRTVPGHAGLQRFFSLSGRAFCLYVVIGDADRAEDLAAEASRALAGITIEPAAASAPPAVQSSAVSGDVR